MNLKVKIDIHHFFLLDNKLTDGFTEVLPHLPLGKLMEGPSLSVGIVQTFNY